MGTMARTRENFPRMKDRGAPRRAIQEARRRELWRLPDTLAELVASSNEVVRRFAAMSAALSATAAGLTRRDFELRA